MSGDRMKTLDPATDGRALRALRTRTTLILTCRNLMTEGVIVPSMERITTRAGLSVRSGFQHFPSIALLYREALEDAGLRDLLAARILQEHFSAVPDAVRARIVAAVVFQQLPPAQSGGAEGLAA